MVSSTKERGYGQKKPWKFLIKKAQMDRACSPYYHQIMWLEMKNEAPLTSLEFFRKQDL